MSRVTVEITGENGMHARPSAALAREASQHMCDIFVTMNGVRVNAKSIMGLLTLAAAQGARLEVECIGEGEDEAVAAIIKLFQTDDIATVISG